jgi:hypothetical protein
VLEEKSISQLLRRKKGSYSGNYHRQRFNPAIVRGNFFRFCKPPYEKARVTSVCPTQRAPHCCVSRSWLKQKTLKSEDTELSLDSLPSVQQDQSPASG